MGKIAIVLNGGVDRGAYQAGALQAIFECIPQKGNDFVIVGTSVGALNGAIIADGLASKNVKDKTQELMELWGEDISPSNIFGKRNAFFLGALLKTLGLYKEYPLLARIKVALFAIFNLGALVFITNPQIFSPWFSVFFFVFILGEAATLVLILAGLFSFYGRGYVFDTKSLRNLLEKHITNKGGRINLVITATHLKGLLKEKHLTFETRFFFKKLEKKKVIDAAIASSAIPLVFPSARVNKEFYVDGGVKNNTPLNYAIDAGVDTIILITHQPKEHPSKKNPFTPLEKFSRIGEILLYDSIENDVRRAKRINKWLSDLRRFKNSSKIKKALNLNHKRFINIIEIRPQHELGGWFEALYNKNKIHSYMHQGYYDVIRKKKEILRNVI